MDELEVDLDDGVRDVPGERWAAAEDDGRPARWRRLAVVGPVAAVALVAGLLVVPRLLPEDPPPRVTVDYLPLTTTDGVRSVDLHEDASGRPTGPVTLTVQVSLAARDVRSGVRRIEVTGPTGPALGADAASALAVGPVSGARASGDLTFDVACDTLPDAPAASEYGVRVAYEGPDGLRTTTADGSFAPALPALLGRVCAARTLRGDVTVTAVEALPDRSGLRVTVENRSRRTVWLRSVLDRGAARDPAAPGTSVHDVRLDGTACALMSVLLGGGGVASDGTTRPGTNRSGSLRIGVMGSLAADAVGPGGTVMPVGLSDAADRDADRAMTRLCGAVTG